MDYPCQVRDRPGQTVVETETFQRTAKTRLSAEEREALVGVLADDPEAGDVMPGTGGMRKLRFATRGRGKRGSVRVIYYFYNAAVPLFLLRVYEKKEMANLSRAERNALRSLGELLVKTYGERA